MAKKKPFDARDAQEILKIITDVTLGITDITEDMQNRILEPVPLVKKVVGGISSISYSGIRSLTKIIGSGVSMTLNEVASKKEVTISPEKTAAISALNGAVGNYLTMSDNALAISMRLRYRGQPLVLNAKEIKKVYEKSNGKILLMVHGLCMSDLQWTREEHNHGELLAEELDLTPVYLHYNSGLHISENGQELSELLEQLINNWPHEVEELHLIGHSMGGLLCRSAYHYGTLAEKNWTKHVNTLAFLGSPHHGSPLEQLGSFVDQLLDAISYAKPFARLGKIRSEGITDLRNGNLITEDWKDKDRFESLEDTRTPIPLPNGVNCYSIAGILAKEENKLSATVLGDGLVYLDSAFGKHKNPDFQLQFDESSTHVVYECGHMELLNNANVYSKLKTWLLRS